MESVRITLGKRASEPELLDSQNAGEREVSRSLWFCEIANRFFGGKRVVRKFLQGELRNMPTDRPVRVLDIGAGLCDIPLAMSRWAAQQGRDLRFACLERHPHAADLARQAVAAANDFRVQVVEGDILSHQPDEPYDYAIGSLFFHHMAEGEILAILERLRTFVRRGVLVNDLRRCGSCYRVWRVVTRFFAPAIRHDLLLSVRRGFRSAELRRLLSHMRGVSVSVTRHWFCRLRGEVRFVG